ncbi:hypothetical protein ROA7745_03918 [Roseovarius aestuarii]|uniref:Uncharacterized protein n=1 Tax=Roseovarius aestuarii TaxID=475083 RepID=A0A1X7BWS2_9RHOB|nr:hypothetical protein ROA7745_03918 [Roseovarius aestuarii]
MSASRHLRHVNCPRESQRSFSVHGAGIIFRHVPLIPNFCTCQTRLLYLGEQPPAKLHGGGLSFIRKLERHSRPNNLSI